ncbi:29355_t:CDS:2, partial [Racocetra persica]
HPSSRQLTEKQQQNVQQISATDISPWEILSTLRQGNLDIKQFDSLTTQQQGIILDKISSLFQESTAVVKDLQIQTTRECPTGSKNIAYSSTRRNLSNFFELVESEKHKRCSLCYD